MLHTSSVVEIQIQKENSVNATWCNIQTIDKFMIQTAAENPGLILISVSKKFYLFKEKIVNYKFDFKDLI
ncbi:hypothetical protein BpHYR1_024992 [Brachionus plicatilis]|uniref:Uncharacterized protein n=1 Tax=Brachionus plicatilis TaxID=10195 RepID=A0A3M7RVC5_BRAPC|nr:hypothetical protein BpHYR1_024992 [Brachionus plicatilis]